MDNQKNTQKNKLNELVDTALENLRGLVDANTVIGNPISTESGTTIIPISKIAMGFASGGMDFNGKNGEATKDVHGHAKNFGGGGGTGLSVTPVGFLICDKDGGVEFINVSSKGKPDPVDQIADLVERTPEIISKIKSLFAKEKAEEEFPEEEDAE